MWLLCVLGSCVCVMYYKHVSEFVFPTPSQSFLLEVKRFIVFTVSVSLCVVLNNCLTIMIVAVSVVLQHHSQSNARHVCVAELKHDCLFDRIAYVCALCKERFVSTVEPLCPLVYSLILTCSCRLT